MLSSFVALLIIDSAEDPLYILMVDEPISDCGCLLCPCLRPQLMRPRRPQISLVRVHQHRGFGPQASEAHEASTSRNYCGTFVVYNRPGPMKRGCPRSGAQDTSAPTNPRVGIWDSVHNTPCLLSGRSLALEVFHVLDGVLEHHLLHRCLSLEQPWRN